MVKRHWTSNFEGNMFLVFHHKLKKVKKALVQWIKETFGNIFQEIIALKEVNKVRKTQLEIDSSEFNKADLHKAQTDLRM